MAEPARGQKDGPGSRRPPPGTAPRRATRPGGSTRGRRARPAGAAARARRSAAHAPRAAARGRVAGLAVRSRRSASPQASVASALAGSQASSSRNTTADRLDAARRSRCASVFETSPTAPCPRLRGARSPRLQRPRSRRPCDDRDSRRRPSTHGTKPPGTAGSRSREVRELEVAVRVHEAGEQHAVAEVAERSVGPRQGRPYGRARRPAVRKRQRDRHESGDS